MGALSMQMQQCDDRSQSVGVMPKHCIEVLIVLFFQGAIDEVAPDLRNINDF
jgi:hypothetical protein